MPKRIPTPPPADNEPRYLTVVHPYVLDGHCNMELPKDRQDFARWIACCIDVRHLYALFTSPVTGRQVEKNNWKRIFVEDAWFKTWSPNNHFIVSPYPETHFCDVPIEDQTNHPMCRPLPGAVKAPPPESLTAPGPVVGSREWISGRQLPAPAAKPAGAWGKGAPKTLMPVGNVWKAAIATSAPQISGVKPAVGGGPIAVKASDVWIGLSVASANGPNGWDSSAGSRRNTPAHSTSFPLPGASRNQTPDVPPGLSVTKAGNVGTSYPTHPPRIPAVPNA
ncbi:hypothetical protein AZE42_09139 [Rhizopogon vesiculosus]|uniref:Uncharacterized protein n=1 Tax=Rhizopogon vesiculosus TaxID=180088 RepID=A0A1J8Q874_9AGAM|nr:hypothetical protein AZE42_09139 [Rhizopogon vesiculosus]